MCHKCEVVTEGQCFLVRLLFLGPSPFDFDRRAPPGGSRENQAGINETCNISNDAALLK